MTTPVGGSAVFDALAQAPYSDEAVHGFNEYDPRRTPRSSHGGTAPTNPAAMVQPEA
jgi:hypothetical protein